MEEYLSLWKDHGVEPRIGKGRKKKSATVTKSKAPGPAKVAKAAPSLPNTLEGVREALGDCKRCGLCETRDKIVFGSGNPKAKLMFVGEGPGADEDAQGLPFVGRAGQLLTKIIEAMNYKREDVYIANIVKCRPPGNRVPEPSEVEQCLPFLKAQIAAVQPEMIVALGATAATHLLAQQAPMGQLRGKVHKSAFDSKTPVVATYHPAYLLRNPPAKKFVWDDMKIVLKQMTQK